MTIFKMYECDFSFTLNDTVYTFSEVENFTIEDPERTRLIRGGNAGNKTGLIYKEGLKEAKTVTVTVIGLPAAVHNLLKRVYSERLRVDVAAVSRADGSSKIAKQAVLSQSPKQLTMDDSAESMNTTLMFESYDVEEVHKS